MKDSVEGLRLKHSLEELRYGLSIGGLRCEGV